MCGPASRRAHTVALEASPPRRLRPPHHPPPRAGAASRGRAARPSGIAAARAGPRGGRAPAFRRATARPDGGDAGAALTDRRGHALGFGGGRERGGLRSDHGRGCRRRDNAGRASSGSGAAGGSLSDVGGGPAGSGARSGARDGGALALAVPGSGSGDPAAADYAGYYDSLRRRLYESLTYPAVARRRNLTGTVIVDVEIDASGKVGRVTVVDSSSHAMLDEAALDALRAVSRVPFPPGVPPRRLRVRLPVVFEIR